MRFTRIDGLPRMAGGIAVAAILAGTLAACGSSTPELGTKTDGGESFQITNELGQDVTAVAAREGTSEDDFPASFMKDDQKFQSGATDEAYLPTDVSAENVDLLFTCNDGTQVLVDDVDVTAADAFTVKSEDGVGYLTYKDADGNEKSTKDASVAAKQAREQKDADQEAADAVVATLTALPAKDALTTDDEAAVTDARAAYDALTDGQKKLVSADSLAKLTDAEAQLQALKEQAAAATQTTSAQKTSSTQAAAPATTAAPSVQDQAEEAAPVEAAPVEAAPAEAAPVEAALVEAAPVVAAPAEPAPVEAAPAEPAPVEAAPAQSGEDCTAENIVLDN